MSGPERRLPVRLWLGALLVGVLVAVARPLVANAQSPSITRPGSPNAAALADLYYIVFFIALGVFLLVQGLIIYAALRFRRRPGDPEPTQIHGNTQIELIWTIVPLVIVMVITVLSYRTLRASIRPAEQALTITVIGHQWWWEFQYRAPAITTTTELVIPVGQTVELRLDSADVIHSFWVPQLAGKMDAVPGARDAGNGQNALWFVASAPGRYEGQCAEFCGAQHSGMRFSVIALAPRDYQAWLDRQGRPAGQPAPGSAAARGQQLMLTRGCQGCHAIDGVPGMVGKVGPNLTHVAERRTLAGGDFANTPENLAGWIDNPQVLKPGALMPELPVSAGEIADIVAYLQSLQ